MDFKLLNMFSFMDPNTKGSQPTVETVAGRACLVLWIT